MSQRYMELFQVILESNIFPVNEVGSYGRTPIQLFMSHRWMCSLTGNPCPNCGPLRRILHTAILQGLDVNCDLKLVSPDSSRGQPVRTTYINVLFGSLHTQDLTCCVMSLFDILLHSGVEVTPLLFSKENDEHDQEDIRPRMHDLINWCAVNIVSDPQNESQIEQVTSVMKALSLSLTHKRFARFLELLVERCYSTLHLNDSVHPIERINQFLEDSFSPEPHSLKQLSRRCIKQHVRAEDVDWLPLPLRLQCYVKVGDALVIP